MMVIAIGVTAGTAGMASTKAGLYVLYIGKFNNERFSTYVVLSFVS